MVGQGFRKRHDIDNTSETPSDEPWDQQLSSQHQQQTSMKVSSMYNQNQTTTPSSSTRRAPEEFMDDGDLPSLANPAVARLFPSTHTEKRQFWGQMSGAPRPSRDESEQTSEDDENEYRRRGSYASSEEEDVPDDELQATGKSRRRRTYKRYNRDESESQLTEEELEEEEDSAYYDATTFCGQTLTALGDICGTNMITGTNSTHEPSDRSLPRPHSRDETIHSRGLLKVPEIKSEAEQEHTAIEVEFIEPPPPSETTSVSSQKKAARLTKMAKRAKDKFHSRSSKKSEDETDTNMAQLPQDLPESADQSPPSSPSRMWKFGKNRGQKSPQASSSPSSRGVSDVLGETPKQSVGDDYGNFSATEKRIFLKLINSGVSASEATKQVLREHEEKSPKTRGGGGGGGGKFWKRGGPSPKTESIAGMTNQAVEDRNFPNDIPVDDGGPEDEAGITSTLSTDADQLEATAKDPFPFKKTGLSYFDAVRREDEEEDRNDQGTNYVAVVKSAERSRSPNFFRSSKGNKPKGFSFLQEGSRSRSEPRQRSALSPGRSKNKAVSPQGFQTVPSSDNRRDLDIADVPVAEPSGPKVVAASVVAGKNYFRSENGNTDDSTFENFQSVETAMDSKDRAVLEGTNEIVDDKAGAGEMSSPPVLPAPSGSRSGEEVDKGLTQEPRDEQKGDDERAEDSMDDYFQSTTEASEYGTALQSDVASVYTAGTSVTGVSNYTHSTRTRRPSVAKQRLAKQKAIEQKSASKSSGWRDSIQKAAQSTNRTWDPEKGWVDYVEPETDELETTPELNDKIHLSLDRSVLSKKIEEEGQGDGAYDGAAPNVPFPEEWRKERDSMIKADPDANRNTLSSAKNSGGAFSAGSAPISNQSRASRSLSPANLSSSGAHSEASSSWVESMRKASAAFAKDGMVWDPKNGWKNANNQETPDDEEVEEIGDVEETIEPSSAEERGLPEKDDAVGIPSPMNDAMPHFSSQADSDSDNDGTPLINQSSTFGSLDHRPISASVVDVVKEKVEGDDMDLFPRKDNGKGASQNATPRSVASRRRGEGPVDLDDTIEATNTSGHSLEKEVKEVPAAMRPTSKTRVVPRLKQSKKDTAARRRPGSAASPVSLNSSVTTSQQSATSPSESAEVPHSPVSDSSAARQMLRDTIQNEAPDSPSVKERLQEWETQLKKTSTGVPEETSRSNRAPIQSGLGAAGWKTFLGKKVRAESEAAANGDSHSSSARAATRSSPITDDSTSSHALNFSDVSSIKEQGDTSTNYDESESDAYGPTEDQRRSSSFLKRMAECAAPVMASRPAQRGADFLSSPVMCGRPDVDDDPESVSESVYSTSTDGHKRTHSIGDEKPGSVASGSVVSEDFGAKTAYLENVARKAAVAKPRRNGSRRRSRSSAGSSVISGTSSVQSEKWKAFLERKKAAGTSPSSRMSSSEVSKAAEMYASQKVEEILGKSSSRSRTVARSRDVHRDIYSDEDYNGDYHGGQKTPSQTAAEDLAAARVEAMMAALSSSNMEEAEI